MNKFSRFALVAASVLASAPAFAEEAAAAAQGAWGGEIRAIAAALAIGLAVIGGASAQGRAAAAANEGIGRNPQSAEKLFTPLILGLALIEFQTIMAFIIAILLATK
jgi:F-type H+-transporting ATPase subunit c